MTRIFCDGSGWNGTESRYAVVPETPMKRRYQKSGVTFNLIVKSGHNYTNNEMEYKAVITALDRFARRGDIILTDSMLVVGQVTRNWKVKADNLRTLAKEAKYLLAERNATLRWVPRHKNLAGNRTGVHHVPEGCCAGRMRGRQRAANARKCAT